MSNANLEDDRFGWIADADFDRLFEYIENCLLLLHHSKSKKLLLKRSVAENAREPLVIPSLLTREVRENLQQKRADRQKKARDENLRMLREFGSTQHTNEADYNSLLGSLWEKRSFGFVNGDWKGFLKIRRQDEGIDDSVPHEAKSEFVKAERRKQETWEKRTAIARGDKIYWLQQIKELIFNGIEIEQKCFRFLHPGTITPREIFESIHYRGPGFPEPDIRRLEAIGRDLTNAIPVSVGHVESFPGYVLYCLTDSPVIIAEKPFHGNATYLLNCSWKVVPDILKNTKTNIILTRSQEAARVIHNSESQWISDIRRLLRYGWS